MRHLFVVHNTTGQTVTVKVAGQTGVAIASGQRVLCFCTGSDVTAFATDAEGLRKVYDIGLFFPGKPEGSELIATFVAARAVTIPAGAPDSQVHARIPPTGAVTVKLQKNGADVGTVAMAAGAATGSFTVSAPVVLAAGDRLSLVAPAVPDATLEGLAVTLAAQR